MILSFRIDQWDPEHDCEKNSKGLIAGSGEIEPLKGLILVAAAQWYAGATIPSSEDLNLLYQETELLKIASNWWLDDLLSISRRG